MTNQTINYHNRYFKMVSSSTGDADAVAGTIFHYRQEGQMVWGTYQGGSVVFGTMLATVSPEGHLDLRFQHLYTTGEIKTGVSESKLTILPDGRYRLDETFHFTGDESQPQQSAVVEFIPA